VIFLSQIFLSFFVRIDPVWITGVWHGPCFQTEIRMGEKPEIFGVFSELAANPLEN
jgi:hypothetical protein